MILKNPTPSTVSIVLSGVPLSVEPFGYTEVTDEQGVAWRKTHAFLAEMASMPAEAKKEVEAILEETEAETKPVETSKSTRRTK